MFVDDGMIRPAPPPEPWPPEISAAALLTACAAEAERQAEGLRKLDAALGQALELSRGSGTPWTQGQGLRSAHGLGLQQADELRQLAEGLARVLALLAERGAGDARLSTADILRCTPILALQQRLLLPADGSATGDPST